MFKIIKPFFLICETPLHAGSGDNLGIVDLPIQRERHTGFPKIESSSLKGGIREAFEEKLTEVVDRKRIHAAFGYDDSEKQEDIKSAFKDNKEYAGALGFTNARILFFPVKSMKNIFAWITCPKVLQRFKNDLQLANIDNMPEIPAPNTCPFGSQLFIKDNKIILEEYAFEITGKAECENIAKWLSENIFPSTKENDPCKYWEQKIKTDIVVLGDDEFKDFVNLSTEVITRTKINNETGTVQKGALFTEEYLPAETILYSLAMASPLFAKNKNGFKENGKTEEEKVMKFFVDNLPEVLQLGGNATIGKGIIRTAKMGDSKNDTK